jgi:hypothetical protein
MFCKSVLVKTEFTTVVTCMSAPPGGSGGAGAGWPPRPNPASAARLDSTGPRGAGGRRTRARGVSRVRPLRPSGLLV